MRSNQSGSHIIALSLFILVVGVIGFTGYRLWQLQQPSTASTTHTATASVPQSIKTTADLTQAASALDDASSQLNSGLDDSALNADLNSML